MITLFSKVWFDLWQDKSRTFQVVMVIALGAIGVGLVIGGRNLVASSVVAGSLAAEPPHIKLSVSPPLTGEQLDRLARIDGVAEVEGLQNAPVEWRLLGSEAWQTGLLKGREDYRAQKMSLDGLLSGEWPGRNTLGIGKVSVGESGVFQGNVVELRYGENVRTLEVVATMDPVGPEPVFGETFYANSRTFAKITGIDSYNLIQTRDVAFDQSRAEATDLLIQDYFEDIGVDSVGVSFPFQDRVVPPDVPPAEAILNALFLLLGVLGFIVVILGIFLVYNSISAIISQQVDQIGVMKAIGADSWQVVWGYLILVLSYGILAAVISIPIGAVAALGLQSFFVSFLNMEIVEVRVDAAAVLVQVAISLVAPFIAALFPLLSGMRITVREAISTYGLTGTISTLDRLIIRVRSVPYTLLLIIGNAFRNRRRVIIIEVALVMAGAIFMMVVGVNDATNYTFGDKLSAVHNYQVTLSMEATERSQEIESIARAVAGVADVESWLLLSASVRPATQVEREVTDARITVFGQPQDTTLYRPEIQEGRWLHPDDTNAAVVSQQVMEEKGWKLGDEITLENETGRELNAQIVGSLFDPATNTSIHMPIETIQREWRFAGLVNTLWVQTSITDADTQTSVEKMLEAALEQSGLRVAASSTFGERTIAGITEQAGEGFDIILRLLAVMAIVIALVGGVGLSGILSLSVLERRREIGVMRAIGASSWAVIRLFVGEAVLLGLISWLIALPISIPIAYGFTTQGLSLALNQQLAYQFTPTGAILWLVIITMLAMVASAVPARGAARISVRESLSYS
jgi:putative ABC transport system permease protein